MATIAQNTELLKHFFSLLESHREVVKQQRSFERVKLLALSEIFTFGRHTITQQLMSLGLNEGDWSAWHRLFNAQRFNAQAASVCLFRESLKEVGSDMGKYRWQIELLFKRWKSDLQLDEWHTHNPHRILCELYAKLVTAIVTQWFLQVSCWQHPKRSLAQAMPTIRSFAWQWANSLHCLSLLKHTLQALVRSLSRCQMDKS